MVRGHITQGRLQVLIYPLHLAIGLGILTDSLVVASTAVQNALKT